MRKNKPEYTNIHKQRSFMYIGDVNQSRHISIKMKCDECSEEYKGKIGTALRQEEIVGHHQCRSCSSRRAGLKTAAKMSKIYSERWMGDKNPMQNKEYRDKISKSLKGRKFSEERKQTLRKPKSKTDKIIEAANRPHERARRSKLALERMNDRTLGTKHCFGNFNVGWVTTLKTIQPIWCRSGLEKRFLKAVSDIDSVEFVESAESMRIQYMQDKQKHVYLPDFKIKFKDESVLIVETKGSYFLQIHKEKWECKEKALKRFCKKNGFKYCIITEKDIDTWLEQLKK